MAFNAEFFIFLTSVVLISLTGVMMPGPLFAVTIEKAAKRKTAGLLIALGHGIVEFPLMFLIYYGLAEVPSKMLPTVQVGIGLTGGLLMVFMGIQTFRNRNKSIDKIKTPKRDSLIAGIWTTAANAGFILWWLTIGTALIITARESFGLLEFAVFTIVHWLCDFFYYTVVAYLIFKSQRFWTKKVNKGIVIFCFAVLIGFGIWFISTAIWIVITTFL